MTPAEIKEDVPAGVSAEPPAPRPVEPSSEPAADVPSTSPRASEVPSALAARHEFRPGLQWDARDLSAEFFPDGNERLDYEVGFLWFDRLADGSLILEKVDAPGHYRAVLEVKTRGMAAMFTSNRRERYESHMTLGTDGYLHSRSFVTRRFKGKGDRVTDHGKAMFFDHEAGDVLYQRSKNGKLTDENHLDLPEHPEVFDFLCAYWNMRLGLFGPMIPGTRLVIPSFTFKGATDIVMEVLDAKEQAQLDYFPVGGILCRLYLDEELFETGGGKMYVWFNASHQPARAIVVDVLGLGDVRGTMVRARNYDGPSVPLAAVESAIHIGKASGED